MARFFRRGVSKVHFLPDVADLDSPSRAEISAGVDLSTAIAEINGFQLSNSPIPTPNLADRFTSQIDGEDTVADSSFTVHDDDTNSDIRDALAKGTEGYILLLPYGDTPTKRCEVWPVKVTGFNDEYTTGNNPAQAMVGFAITATPEQNAVVPAAT
jgi:hypothetical protein